MRRLALVNAAGGWTSSQAYTDEDGYYELRVAIGDSVAFSAHTWVGGKQWSSSWSESITGEGECGNDPTEIPVCREAGIVMADNLELHLNGMDAGSSGDQLRAWFWEPPGDPELCVAQSGGGEVATRPRVLMGVSFLAITLIALTAGLEVLPGAPHAWLAATIVLLLAHATADLGVVVVQSTRRTNP